MHTTYARPQDLAPDQVDAAAPAGDVAPTADTCGATTTDSHGTDWTCTRPKHPGPDEHRAAFDVGGYGPPGTVGLAWTDA